MLLENAVVRAEEYESVTFVGPKYQGYENVCTLAGSYTAQVLADFAKVRSIVRSRLGSLSTTAPVMIMPAFASAGYGVHRHCKGAD